MAKISGSTHLKVQRAPPFWNISRKKYRFALKPVAGPYAISESYSLGVLLRDILKFTNSMREARHVILEGKINVDGKIRYDEHFPVGLMNIISIESINKHYRLVPSNKVVLIPLEIDDPSLKICKIKRKVTIRGNKMQYGLHDGRTIINDNNFKVNDSLLIKVPEQQVIQHIRLEKGADAMIIKGDNAGKLGKIEDIKAGTYILPKRIVLSTEDRVIELPIDMAIVVGNDNNIPVKVR